MCGCWGGEGCTNYENLKTDLGNKIEKLTSTKAIKASDNSTSGFPLTTFIRSPTPEQSKYLKNYGLNVQSNAYGSSISLFLLIRKHVFLIYYALQQNWIE